MECTICLESCNKSTKKDSTCLFCNRIFCRKCLQDCLLLEESIEIHCPSCKVIWNREFIDTVCTAAFRKNPFKAHREKVLVDSERIRLPDTQEDAIRYEKAKIYMETYKAMCPTIKSVTLNVTTSVAYINLMKANHKINLLGRLLHQTRHQMKYDHGTYNIPGGNRVDFRHNTPDWESCRYCKELYEAYEKKHALLLIKYQKRKEENTTICQASEEYHRFNELNHIYSYIRVNKYKDRVTSFGYRRPLYGDAPVEVPVEKRKFIKACPVTDCRGFLSTQWKCGLCSVKVCNKCHDPITTESHICDAEKVASVALIAAEAKPCPKCSAMISKVSGCDQMFCTECKTAFSWRTGAIETGVMHNPHYFQWKRAGGGAPAPAGIPACGIDQRELIQLINYRSNIHPPTEESNRCLCIFGRYTRVQHYEHILQGLQQYLAPQPPAVDVRRVLRVRYLTKEITEEDWKIALQKHEKQLHVTQSRAHLLEMFLAAFRDIINTFATATSEDIIRQMNDLLLFTMEQYEAMNKRYHLTTDISSYIPVWSDSRFTPPEKKKKAAAESAAAEPAAEAAAVKP